MWNNKKQLEDAIIAIAEHLGAESAYKTMFSSIGYTMPQIVKMLIYDMFICKFDQTTCPLNLYAYYTIVYEYVKELNDKGYVEFSKN